MRTVHRAAADLRRGAPVILIGETPLVLLSAETAGPQGLAEFDGLAGGRPVLLLAPVRAAAVLHRPVEPGTQAMALRLGEELVAPESLRGLADPTVEELLPAQPEPAPVPALASAALILAKLARLLPAVLAAPLAPRAGEDGSRPGLFAVPAEDLMS